MFNLNDIMQSAQGGGFMQNLARAYGLSPNQAQSAVEALLPAFTLGLQRQMGAPDLMGNFARMMAGGQQLAGFYDANGDGIPDDVPSQGNDLLGQLFGTKEVSRQVAAQASAMTGIGTEVLKAMLPVIATTLMGGLFKSMTGQGQSNPLAAIAAMFGQGGFGQGGFGQGGFGQGGLGQGGLGQNPFGQGMPFGMPAGGFPMGQPADMNAAMSGMMERMMGAGSGAGDETVAASQRGLDALSQMFDTGRQVQDEQMAALQSVFDAFLKPGAKPEKT
jgi:hypothetical protein